jgi:hypothetical protein
MLFVIQDLVVQSTDLLDGCMELLNPMIDILQLISKLL